MMGFRKRHLGISLGSGRAASGAAVLAVLAVVACAGEPPLAPAMVPGDVSTSSHNDPVNFGAALVGWWRFDDAAASPAVIDDSGLVNHGQLMGAAAYTSDALLHHAVDIMGASGVVTVPNDVSLEPETGTIQLWIRVPALKDADVVAKVTSCMVRRNPDCSPASGGSVIGLRIEEDGGVTAFIANDDPAAVSPWTFAGVAANAIEPGTWHHLAMRWDGAQLTLFIDGQPLATAPYDPVPGTGLSYYDGSPLWLAAATSWGEGHPGDREFIGQIDEVRFYARARSDVEVFTDFITKGHKPAKP